VKCVRPWFGTLAVSTIALVVAMSAVPAMPAGALTRSQLRSKALSLSNMPAGWTVASTSSSGGGSSTSALMSGCLKGVPPAPKDQTVVKVAYRGSRIPLFGEELGWGRGALSGYNRVNEILGACRHFSGTSEGRAYSVTVEALSFPKFEGTTSAYSVKFTSRSTHVTTDLVLLRVGPVECTIVYSEVGQPDPNQLQGFVSEAINKIEGKQTTPPTSSL
jgi:hypothetical protein